MGSARSPRNAQESALKSGVFREPVAWVTVRDVSGELTNDIVRSFHDNGLPNFPGAMAFRVVLALVPPLLLLLAVLGFRPRGASGARTSHRRSGAIGPTPDSG